MVAEWQQASLCPLHHEGGGCVTGAHPSSKPACSSQYPCSTVSHSTYGACMQSGFCHPLALLFLLGYGRNLHAHANTVTALGMLPCCQGPLVSMHAWHQPHMLALDPCTLLSTIYCHADKIDKTSHSLWICFSMWCSGSAPNHTCSAVQTACPPVCCSTTAFLHPTP